MNDAQPTLADHATHRAATWIELFFDLIFVVAIAKAAHVLLHSHDGHIESVIYIKYLLIMIPLWWAWTGCTLYSSRFDCDDVIQRLMSFAQMFCVVVLAVNINLDFDSYYRGFLAGYVGIRFFTVLMYLRASLNFPEKRHVSDYLAYSFSMGIAISLCSLFFEGIPRYIILYAGIAFDIAMPLIGSKRLKTVPVNSHHLPERFGLLTIILFGEAVLSLANSFDKLSWSSSSVLMALCGFILACSLWWLYFDNMQRKLAGRIYGHGQSIIYSHILIYLGLGGIAAMVGFAINPQLNLFDYKVLVLFSIVNFILALQFVHFIFHTGRLRKRLLLNAVIFNSLLVGLVVFGTSIIFIMISLTIITVCYVIIDSYTYNKYIQ